MHTLALPAPPWEAGIAGPNLGTVTPVLGPVANSVWGVVAAWVYDHSGK